METSLPPDQLTLLRQLVRPAPVLLALAALGRPAGAREIAAILDLNEHTVSKYLRQLSELNLVARLSFHQGYILIGFPQLVLGEDPAVKNLQVASVNTTTINTIGRRREIEAVVVVDSDPSVKKLQVNRRTVKNLQIPPFKEKRKSYSSRDDSTPPADPAVVLALQQARIGEPKRSQIASLPHVTPDVVRLWEAYLVDLKGEKYTPGLLVHILENGDPPPPTNEYGHFKGCRCSRCDPYAVYTCPDCFTYPCECELGDEEGEDEQDA